MSNPCPIDNSTEKAHILGAFFSTEADMPNLRRPYDRFDMTWMQTQSAHTLARLQSGILRSVLWGNNPNLPEYIEIMGETDPLFPRRVVIASGFLVEILEPYRGICEFILHADEFHKTPNGTPYIILNTVVVELHINGMMYIKTHSKIASQTIVDKYRNQGLEKKDNVILLPSRATSA